MEIEKRIDKYLNEAENTLLFNDLNEAKDVAKEIEKKLDLPFVKVNKMPLSSDSDSDPSLAIIVSLDKKEDWTNNILENSRFSKFSLDPDPSKNNLSQINKYYNMKKTFRKQKAKSVKEAINKIKKYMDSFN